MNEEGGKVTLTLDGVPCRLRQGQDFSWLRSYGRVARVWDEQFSGNLCFGMEGEWGPLFIKYAGAWTVNGMARPWEAVMTLKNAVPIYQLSHPSLIPLLAHGPAGEGYAAVFPWIQGQTLREMGPGIRYIALEKALKMLDGIFDLHAHLAENGYVSVDFSDGNVLMDFDRALVFDVDLYRRKPAVNDRGRMWGSSRFLAPEEYQIDAPLDEGTTVYHMGSLAFAFFGDGEGRGPGQWTGPSALWGVADRACRERKEERYPSVRAFLDAWREGVGRIYW